jgi:MFS family permease
MTTQLSHHRSRHWLATGMAGTRLSRLATVLAAAISGLLASAVAATAAFANPIPVGDGDTSPITQVPPATVRVISVGGMAGWQVALIAAGAALAAAAAAVLADRKLAGRRSVTATTA